MWRYWIMSAGSCGLLGGACSDVLAMQSSQPPLLNEALSQAAQEPTGTIQDEATAAPLSKRVAMRVIDARASGIVVVDRGAGDGLQVGDQVTFTPKGAAPLVGNILSLDARTAQVELLTGTTLELGTRGEAWATSEPPPQTDSGPEEVAAQKPTENAVNEVSGQEGPVTPEPLGAHPGWTKDEWTPDQPLLTQLAEVHPEERPVRWRGSVSWLSQRIITNEDDRSDRFDAIGLNTTVDNPFGLGGRWQLDGAWTDRNTTTPDVQGEDDTIVRLDRLSYSVGGTRFESNRWEVGRFLQRGMPEFGLLDGVEWGSRRRGGDRYGFSVGYMPEPDPEQNSGDDFQLAGYYEWVSDAREELTAALGFQTTWNDGTADRDLLVGRVRYAPATGWNTYASIWVDLYNSDDEAKGSGLGLTLADVVTRRSFGDSGVEFGYRHLEFPELLRNEFEPVTLEQLADDHLDRAYAEAWVDLGSNMRLRARGGGWIDEDDDGYEARAGLEFFDLVGESDRWELSGFLTEGRFSVLQGVRIGAGLDRNQARYDLAFEALNTDQTGFEDNNDDFRQSRLVASAEWYWNNGWVLTVEADGIAGTDPDGLRLALFAQKNF